LCGIQDQVSGDHLSGFRETTLGDVHISSFFPDNGNMQQLKRDFMSLWMKNPRERWIGYLPYPHPDTVPQPKMAARNDGSLLLVQTLKSKTKL